MIVEECASWLFDKLSLENETFSTFEISSPSFFLPLPPLSLSLSLSFFFCVITVR